LDNNRTATVGDRARVETRRRAGQAAGSKNFGIAGERERVSAVALATADIWHKRLGNLHLKGMRNIVPLHKKGKKGGA